MKTIIESAVFSNGKIYTGKRHCHCMKKINLLGKRPSDEVQGFMTSEGKFVNRVQGAVIAIESGQIKELRYSKTELYSEDLY